MRTAPGYSAAMGCFLSPVAAVSFVQGQLAADDADAALKMAAE